jgi:hypothetical protein
MKRPNTIGCLWLLIVLVAGAAHGQPGIRVNSMVVASVPVPEVSEPTEPVADLVAQLADATPDRQPSLMQSLLAMGPAIAPQLRGALRQIPPAPTFPYVQPDAGWSNRLILVPELRAPHSQQYALEMVLSHLTEQQQAQSSRVTLHFQAAPLTNVLAEFGRQIHTGIDACSLEYTTLDWVRTNRLTINVDNASYWQVMQLLEAHDIRPLAFSWIKRFSLIQGTEGGDGLKMSQGRDHSAINGPLRITPVAVELTHTHNLVAGTNTARVKLTLQAQAEPKFIACGEDAMVQLDECVDEHGESLLPADAPKFRQAPRARWQVPVEFNAPGAGRRIRTLKGWFSVALTPGQHYLAFTNVMHAAGQMQEFDGQRLTIREAKPSWDGKWNELLVEASAPAGSPFAATFTNSPDVLNLSLFDAERKWIPLQFKHGIWVDSNVDFYERLRDRAATPAPLAAREFGEVRHEAGRDVLPCRFYLAKDLRPDTLLWLTPPETRWFTVPFELQDLELP